MHASLTRLRCGIDLGSTTAKVVICADSSGLSDGGEPPAPLWSTYRRHDTRVRATLAAIFTDVQADLGDVALHVCLTGSAGMGVAEQLGLPFAQEVVVAADFLRAHHPGVRTLLDIGGEDSKLILCDDRGRADIRMNGSCAGGTGAFIDQMAALLDVPMSGLDALARKATTIVPIASRCGVFAKTDVQTLMSRSVAKPDIAASIFHAVAIQVVNTLARAWTASPQLVLSGGPLTFLQVLREVTIERLGLKPEDVLELPNLELISALGAALSETIDSTPVRASGLCARLATRPGKQITAGREPPLFATAAIRDRWMAERFLVVPRAPLSAIDGRDCFIGIDSGSTTTKLVAVDEQGRLVADHYMFNRGDHVGSVQACLSALHAKFEQAGVTPRIAASAATGYGEDLIHNVFGLDLGIVETIAHLRAAREAAPDVSFVLDIGGQDMKAMYVKDGRIDRIEINEACSSGCGSFLSTFAEVLGIDIADFARQACTSPAPARLGSRCTVFMNSRVKQCLREGAGIDDIAAGLAYAVIRNCLEKVLRIHDPDKLGEVVVVQGGTFLNPAIQRAFELLTGKRVVCPDIAGVIGAWGAALVALDHHHGREVAPAEPRPLPAMAEVGDCRTNDFVCGACENSCTVTRLRYPGRRAYFSGNRCEKVISNKGREHVRGENLGTLRTSLLFERDLKPVVEAPIKVGIPRALNLFENLPFWTTLLRELGAEPVVSSRSTNKLYQAGSGTIMSDSICFPAKLVHGHIVDLAESGVDHIFYPQVVHELPEGEALSSFNCPIVSGYPEVIRSSVNPEKSHGIPLHIPVITFADRKLLAKGCKRALAPLGLDLRRFRVAFARALDELGRVRREQQREGEKTVARAAAAGRKVVLLVGRPYHADRLINQGIPEMLADMGLDVITTESVPADGALTGLQVLTQWAFPNRLYHAARYAAAHDHIEVVQVNSFGCGPDAIASDELSAILRAAGKSLTVIRVDETASTGAIRLRLRTLVETLALRGEQARKEPEPRIKPKPFSELDKRRTILGPSFLPVLDPFTGYELSELGYKFEILPPPDAESVRLGTRYLHNEICYPALLIAGDMLRALESGKYKPEDVAVAITMTGGQCRASCYAALIGKALVKAGYHDVPVVTIHFEDDAFHDQPGFKLDKLGLLKRGYTSIVVADALGILRRATLPRELDRGAGAALAERLTEEWLNQPERSTKAAVRFVRRAVAEFNRLRLRTGPMPRIGIVGEIYVKYVEFSNHGVVQWLADRGVEAVVPAVSSFFLQALVNGPEERSLGVTKGAVGGLIARALQAPADRFLRKVNAELAGFPYAIPISRPGQLAAQARRVMALSNSYGEGWLIPGEILELGEAGVDDILCLQPFGCIANQVVAKGVEKRLREVQPGLNILFADLDHNVSEANLFNRLHFLVRAAEATMKAQQQGTAGSIGYSRAGPSGD